MYVYVFSTHLNIDDGDGGLGLVEVPSHPVHCLRDKIQHKIQVHLIFLVKRTKRPRTVNKWKVNVSFSKANFRSMQSVVPGKFTKSTINGIQNLAAFTLDLFTSVLSPGTQVFLFLEPFMKIKFFNHVQKNPDLFVIGVFRVEAGFYPRSPQVRKTISGVKTPQVFPSVVVCG